MSDFKTQYDSLYRRVYNHGLDVPATHWQSQVVTDRPGMEFSRELRHETFKLRIPGSVDLLKDLVKPNLPWAEDHFQERISGQPLNPPPSEAYWPYAQRGNAEHKTPFDDQARFSHTYPERIWPKYAGGLMEFVVTRDGVGGHRGIRYDYGDLRDMIRLLARDPLTRQAYLPIWFPEDTGAVENQRVPCTLGYHFLFRHRWDKDGPLAGDIVYYIRSCDLLRHFTDDVYMACRLLQHVVGMLRDYGINAEASMLYMHISSLHVFAGDLPGMKRTLDDAYDERDYGAAV